MAEQLEQVDDLDARKQAILDALFRRDHVTANHICYATGLEHFTVWQPLAALVDDGAVVPETEPEPTGGRGYRRTFFSLA